MAPRRLVRFTDYNFNGTMKELIQRYMRKHYLLQVDFARLMKMKPGDYSNLINGKQRWTLNTLQRAQEILQIDIFIGARNAKTTL